MTSPRNKAKQSIQAERAASTPKSNNNNNNNRKKTFNNILGKIRLRPLEKIGLGLLSIAILYWVFSGKSEPEIRPIEQIAAPEELEEKASNLRPLYIIIDSLKLRAQPKLDSNFIRYLAFDETVYDMGEQTKIVQTIRYSADEIRTEPWVKIRTESGEIGWVFGAGVNFYRKKRRIGVPDSISTTTNNNTGLTTITETSTTTTPATTSVTTPATSTATSTATGITTTSTITAPSSTNNSSNTRSTPR